MKREEPLVLRDSENVRNIIVQVDIRNNKTGVWSGFSAWENVALLIEALAATANECVKQGMSKEKVYKGIYDYISKSFPTYK